MPALPPARAPSGDRSSTLAWTLGVVDGGQVLRDRLRSELVTLPELVSAAHKQGFDSLEEVERAVLETGGTISFIGKKTDVATQQFHEVTSRLDQIARQVAELAARPPA